MFFAVVLNYLTFFSIMFRAVQYVCFTPGQIVSQKVYMISHALSSGLLLVAGWRGDSSSLFTPNTTGTVVI